jgi:hypothetical protein
MWKLNPLKNGSYQTAHLQTSLTCNPEYLHAARLHSTTVTFPCRTGQNRHYRPFVQLLARSFCNLFQKPADQYSFPSSRRRPRQQETKPKGYTTEGRVRRERERHAIAGSICTCKQIKAGFEAQVTCYFRSRKSGGLRPESCGWTAGNRKAGRREFFHIGDAGFLRLMAASTQTPLHHS